MTGAIRSPLTLLFFIVVLSGCGSTLHKAVKSGDEEAVKQAIGKGESVDGFKHGSARVRGMSQEC